MNINLITINYGLALFSPQGTITTANLLNSVTEKYSGIIPFDNFIDIVDLVIDYDEIKKSAPYALFTRDADKLNKFFIFYKNSSKEIKQLIDSNLSVEIFSSTISFKLPTSIKNIINIDNENYPDLDIVFMFNSSKLREEIKNYLGIDDNVKIA